MLVTYFKFQKNYVQVLKAQLLNFSLSYRMSKYASWLSKNYVQFIHVLWEPVRNLFFPFLISLLYRATLIKFIYMSNFFLLCG